MVNVVDLYADNVAHVGDDARIAIRSARAGQLSELDLAVSLGSVTQEQEPGVGTGAFGR
jgi:hypothetical protein